MMPSRSSDEQFSAAPYQLGQCYLVCTVTNYYTGRLVHVTPHELVLEDAAWVAHTGRFAHALTTGDLQEVEPFPDGPVLISRAALIAVCQWDFPLPRFTR